MSQSKRGIINMKKVRLQNNMRIIGIRNFRGGAKRIDYFLITPGNEKLYAFSCTYTHKSYDMCKSGIMVNDVVGKRSRDPGVMRLVNQTKRMIPYLAEIYVLPLAA